MISKKNESLHAFFFILPAIIFMIFVFIIPIICGVYISLLDLNVFNLSKFIGAPFVGFNNYLEIFSNKFDTGKIFLGSLWNILYFGIIVITISYIIALLIANYLNKSFIGKGFLIALILLPYFTIDTVVYGVWGFMFQADSGIVNRLLYDLKIIKEPMVWLMGERQMIPVIIATIWKTWPFLCLILLAGMQGIPVELYEAAEIDGASKIQLFFKITLPLLWPLSKTLLLLSSIWMIHSYNNFFVMLGPGLSTKTMIPSLAIASQLRGNLNFGLGSAMSVILLIIIFIFTTIILLNNKKEVKI